MNIEQRKKDHVDLCVSGKVAYTKSSGFERYDFIHNALPEINFSEVNTRSQLLGRWFDFPLFISSMTGGYNKAESVNAIIARFCERNNLPFGVGSQRVMLENPEAVKSFEIVRKYAPNAFIAANIGGCQLLKPLKKNAIDIIINAIRADACIIHLNPLQELMQPEGDRNFKGISDQIRNLCETIDIPVIVKETGAGISPVVAEKLIDAGVKVIDLAGSGGTSWSKVENERAGIKNSVFNNWGIPTAVCLEYFAEESLKRIEVIASGGIRNSLDIGKALCLGAHFTGVAQPVIKAIVEDGEEGLEQWYQNVYSEFRILMCLLGVSNPVELGKNHLRFV